MLRRVIAVGLVVLVLAASGRAQSLTMAGRVPTYIIAVGVVATTAATFISIESPATQRVLIHRVCFTTSVATAAAAVSMTISRRTTASSAGTLLTAEGTPGTAALAKLDPADANFPGVVRSGGTPGTAGALVDIHSWTVGELGAGAADPNGPALMCVRYGVNNTKPIVIAAGTTNGVLINLGAAGAGGLAAGVLNVLATVEP